MVSPAHFKIVENIVYAEPEEFMHISYAEVEALYDVVKDNITGNFGLIEIRPRKTSIDPVVYQYAKKLMPQFTAFALVVESELSRKFTHLEQEFANDIRFRVFRTLVEAEFWIQTVLANEGKS